MSVATRDVEGTVPSLRTTWSRLTDESPRLVLVVLVAAVLAWFSLVFLHGGDGASLVDHHRLGGTADHHGEAAPVGQAHDHGTHDHGTHDHGTHDQGAHDHGATHEHGTTPDPGGAGLAAAETGLTRAALLVLGGWAVMVVAMMVPPALPMLSVVGRLVSRRRHARLLLLAGTATFVAAWTVVGAGMITGDAVLHALTEDLGSAWHVDSLVPGATVIAAGVYQLTPLKRSCLKACRSPRSFALAHWRGRRAAVTEVMTVTGAYALACIGCCWALMAISFAVGVAALPVMVGLTVLMAAERLLPWGRRLATPTGVLLIALGAAIALRPFLAGPTG